MNEKEQIKDMADIATQVHNNSMAELAISQLFENENYVPSPIAIVNALYEAGYRKQSDTVKEFANELNALLIEHDTGKFGLLHAKSAMRMVKELAKEYGAEVE